MILRNDHFQSLDAIRRPLSLKTFVSEVEPFLNISECWQEMSCIRAIRSRKGITRQAVS